MKFRRPAERILEIVLDNPGRLNATDARKHEELAYVWRDIGADPDVSVAIIRGAGEAFSAGGDFALIEDIAKDFATRTRVRREAREMVYIIINCSKPLVSAMHGPGRPPERAAHLPPAADARDTQGGRQGRRALLIIADEMEGEALAALVVKKLGGGLKLAPIKAPGFGDERKALLGDIAALVGTEVVRPELGQKLENMSLPRLGRARRATISRDKTVLVGSKGRAEAIQERTAAIRTQLQDATRTTSAGGSSGGLPPLPAASR